MVRSGKYDSGENHITSYTGYSIHLDKIKHFQNGYHKKKEIYFFSKAFPYKIEACHFICGFYGSANMGAAGQIVAKMNKTGHCPSRFFQPHPAPSKETVPTPTLGDTASCHALGTIRRQSRALILQVWSSPSHIRTSWKYQKCKFPGPAQAYGIRNSEGAAQLPGFSQALQTILTQAAV